MKKVINVFIFLLCILSTFRVLFSIFVHEKVVKENKKVIGNIINIKKDSSKTVLDIKSDINYRITLYSNLSFNLGDKVSVTGVFENAPNNTIPNLFNYHKYLLSKGIRKISSNPKVVLIKKNKNVFFKIKNMMITHINSYKTSSFIKAFLLGDKSEISDNSKSNYNNIGISHLFAVSGMHISIILLFINMAFKRFKYKNIIIIISVSFIVFLTNYTESILRCSLFMLLSYINKILKTNYNNCFLLVITACFLLLFNPYLIYSIGFLLSVIITFFIFLSKDKLHGIYILKVFKLSFICFLGSIPILIRTYFKINFLTPIFNTILIPIISFIIFPLGIITFFVPFLDNFYLFLIETFEYLVEFFSKITWLTFTVSKPSLFIILLYYIILFLYVNKNKSYIIFFLLLLILNINSKYFILKPTVTMIDVGQGDSSLIILPKGKSIVIDTGGLFRSRGSISKNKIIPYLNSKGISDVDTLILSHGDFDHMGEAVELVNTIKIKKVIFNCGEYNKLEKELVSVLEKKSIKYYSCIENLNIGKYQLQFLNTKVYDNENDNSLVFYLNYNSNKFLFMGDAGVEREKDILEKYNLTDIDFLKVGHHGSNTSSSEYFISSINPKNSLISVGKNNRYGHPKDRVLNILENSEIYRTDLDGSIEIKLNKSEYKIKTCPP